MTRLLLAALLVLAAPISAQDARTPQQTVSLETGQLTPADLAPKEPALTTEQKLTIRILAQQMEIAQLKAQAAQRDFDVARAELMKVVQSLQREGYDLDLSTMTYAKKPETPPAEKK